MSMQQPQPQESQEQSWGAGEQLIVILVCLVFGFGLRFAIGHWYETQESRYTAALEASLQTYKLQQMQDAVMLSGVSCKPSKEMPSESSSVLIEMSSMSGRNLLRVYGAVSIPGLPEQLRQEFKGKWEVIIKADPKAIVWVCDNIDTAKSLSALIKARDLLDPPCNVDYYINTLSVERNRTCPLF